MNKARYADPLEVCSVDPLDYRMINGNWVIEPGWWKELKKDKSKKKNATKNTRTRKQK